MRKNHGGVESRSNEAAPAESKAPKSGKPRSSASKDIVTSSVVLSSAHDPPPPKDTTVAVGSRSAPVLHESSAQRHEKTVLTGSSRIRKRRHRSDSTLVPSALSSGKGRKLPQTVRKEGSSRQSLPAGGSADVVTPQTPSIFHPPQEANRGRAAQETSSAPLRRLDATDLLTITKAKRTCSAAGRPPRHTSDNPPLDQTWSSNPNALGLQAVDIIPSVSASLPRPSSSTPHIITEVSSTAIVSIPAAIAAVDTEKTHAEDTHCGCFGYYRPFLQRFRSMRWMLLLFCLTSFTRSFSMNGILLVVLPTLERRYSMSGSQSGTIVSSNNMASCLMMLPVSFLSSNRHKPRIVGLGLLLVGVGNFVISLAHFLAPPYRVKGGADENCPRVETGLEGCSAEDIRKFRFVMIAGQILAGVGATPINTVSIAYLDENLPPEKSAAYIGIFNSMAVLGPSTGFIVGGMTLRYFVDVATDIKAQQLTPKSGAWIGAWWIGFVMSTAMGLVLGTATSMLPKHLPEYYEYKEDQKQVQDLTALTMSGLQSHDFGARLTDLPKAVLRLCKNRPLMFLCLGSSFSRPVVLVGGAGGSIAGGILVARLKLGNAGILRMCVCNCVLSIFGVLVFRLYCPDSDLAMNDSGDPKTSTYEFPCNRHCHCSEDVVDPVCTADNVVFLSPCYAGCRISVESEIIQAYAFCSCVNGSMPLPGKPGESRVQAVRSKCTQSCGLLVIYVLGVCLCMSSVFLNLAPSTAATIRVVKPAERSLALGVKVVISRIFGSIPAPVIFGTIVDGSCQAWHRRCGEIGSCFSYTNRKMAHGIFFTLMMCMAACMVSYAIALYLLTRHHHKGDLKRQPVPEDEEEQEDDACCDSPVPK